MWHIHDRSDWFLMVVAMALFWAPLLLIAFWAFGRATSPSPRPPDRTDDGPREIARRSYARGDISRERFHEIIEDLDRTDRGGAT